MSNSSNGRQVLETALAQTEASLSEAAGLCAMAMKVQQVLWFVPGYCEPSHNIKYAQISMVCVCDLIYKTVCNIVNHTCYIHIHTYTTSPWLQPMPLFIVNNWRRISCSNLHLFNCSAHMYVQVLQQLCVQSHYQVLKCFVGSWQFKHWCAVLAPDVSRWSGPGSSESEWSYWTDVDQEGIGTCGHGGGFSCCAQCTQCARDRVEVSRGDTFKPSDTRGSSQ